jgi:glycosyltransferase involved in cell wall biosynthesis
MTITIAIPTHNQQDTLEESIKSALAQTVPCEIIVVNDGSTDNTKFILSEYEEKVKVIHQVNKGLPSARNTAIMHATGDYLLPLDSDDTLEPTCVERILQVIEDTNADIVSPSFKTFGVQSQLTMLGMRPTLDDFKGGNRVGYCSAIRLSALKEIGGYSPAMKWGWEDYHLWFNLLLRGKTIVTIPDYLWNYRVKPFSMITVANQHAAELRAQINKDFPGLDLI